MGEEIKKKQKNDACNKRFISDGAIENERKRDKKKGEEN